MVYVLPVISLSMILLLLFSATNSKDIIEQKTAETMTASLDKAVVEVLHQFNSIDTTGNVLAKTVASDYKEASLDSYEHMLKTIVADNDIVLGSGLWFEPYVWVYLGRYFA
ncbi:MAG: hypothetical protein J6P60_03305 [Lachnospiraceae bacterium]|nr:hypothetical protein [Lachnospiraceae bacterium]